MQAAVIYLELLDQPHWGYQKPLLDWVNRTFRHITTLDVDSGSDRMMIDYACRLITESEKCVVYVVAGPEAGFGSAARIVELLLQSSGNKLVLLQGKNERLQRIFAARPQFPFHQSENEPDLRNLIKKYLLDEPIPSGS